MIKMKDEYLHNPVNYFTAIINGWKTILAKEYYKYLITGSLQNLDTKNRCPETLQCKNALTWMLNHFQSNLNAFLPIVFKQMVYQSCHSDVTRKLIIIFPDETGRCNSQHVSLFW